MSEVKNLCHEEEIPRESDPIKLEKQTNDGGRFCIDYILAWEKDSESELAEEQRQIFTENLKQVGLILYTLGEYQNTKFLSIVAPLEVVRNYAEILKLRKPMKRNRKLPPDAKLTAIYTREREYLFNESDNNFFTPKDRAAIVDFILNRTRYSADEEDDSAIGLQRLRKENVYTGAYPLHNEEIRKSLNQEWATLRASLKRQDLDKVKEYFGVKIGLYFAWLGFYTCMLIPAAVLGILTFLYGLATLAWDQHSLDVCNGKITDLMCPLCNNLCDYWDIKETCFYTRITYLFDNDMTLLFAFAMSLWSAVFIECWKRYSAEISHRWDLTAFDISHEQPRPEYYRKTLRQNLVQSTASKRNRITQQREPAVPFWQYKMPFTVFSLSAVLFLILLAIAVVLGVIVYRASVAFAMSSVARENPSMYKWSLIVVNITAGIINLIVINLFGWIYSTLAMHLTEMEMHRTEASFENSLTWKMYLLQFVNCYSSIMYVAFFKGKFVGTPHRYAMTFGFRQEECGPGGCMTELCIQLSTIMMGNQAINAVQEMLVPWLLKKLKQLKWRELLSGKFRKGSSFFDTDRMNQSQWIRDEKLLDWGQQSLFNEYLEMVLQYGFVTIFVAAFPLAPFFALLNNILELRLDARKFLNTFKRPIAQRVKDIGVWYTILNSVSSLAVVTNGFIIAMTSNFIPKFVYRLEYGSLDGFLEHSLAYFNTSDPGFIHDTSPLQSIYGDTSAGDIKVCRYQSYRDYYFLSDDKKFDRTTFYWEVWMFRLLFVVIFQNVVSVIVVILKWAIPDIPKKLNDQIRRENYWTMQAVIAHEHREKHHKEQILD